jgi:hypothetical protein
VGRETSIWLGCALALLAALGGAEAKDTSDPAHGPAKPAVHGPSFNLGERLEYRARVWKGFSWFGFDVGEAVFKVGKEEYRGHPAWRLVAEATGGGFGYKVRSDAVSYVAADDGRPLYFCFEQTGSEFRGRRLEFEPGKIVYYRRSHCINGACKNPNHQIVRGGRRVHCDRGHDCEDPQHWIWERRSEHVGAGDATDMLAAVYLARTLDLGGPKKTIRVVDADNVYDVDVLSISEEKVKTDAGSFRTRVVALEPHFVSTTDPDGPKGQRFHGLFGLSGTIRIWLDKATNTPVRIRGTIPFGIDLNGEVELVSRH